MDREEIYRTIEEAISALAESAEDIVEAMTGSRPTYTEQQCKAGPFAQTLYRIAQICELGVCRDKEQAKRDMLYVLRLTDHLNRNFMGILKPILNMAMETIDDLISIPEAAEILGKDTAIVVEYVRSGALHSLVRREDDTYSTWLMQYEVEEIKQKR